MEIIRIFINKWVVGGAVILAIIITGGIIIFFASTRHDSNPIVVPEIAFTQIKMPTATMIPATLIPLPTSTPTPELPPTPEPGTIGVGAFVQIANTGGVGLNLRSDPTINSSINYLGFEAEVFKVLDGPISADGFTWYYLAGFYDDSRNGWGVTNYLEVIQNP